MAFGKNYKTGAKIAVGIVGGTLLLGALAHNYLRSPQLEPPKVEHVYGMTTLPITHCFDDFLLPEQISSKLQEKLDFITKHHAALYVTADWCSVCRKFGPTIKESAHSSDVELLTADYSNLRQVFRPFSQTFKKNGVDPGKLRLPGLLISSKNGLEVFIGGGIKNGRPYMVASDGAHTPLSEIYARVSTTRPSD